MNSEIKRRLIDALESARINAIGLKNQRITNKNLSSHNVVDTVVILYKKEITECQALITELQNND